MSEEKENQPEDNTISLRGIFMELQRQMATRLEANKKAIRHPGTKGDATEIGWIEMLNTYLPKRYRADKAFVLDSRGGLSGQIDIVVFDNQYSPFLFNQDGAKYVPAESVYAVFEVKPSISKEEIEYAASKAESVRRLHRTSTTIVHAGGKFTPRPHFDIIAGILALDSSWNPPFGDSFSGVINSLEPDQRINIGCVLKKGGFNVEYHGEGEAVIKTSATDDALIFFFLELMSALQQLGTAPAIDIEEYAKSLKS